MFGFSASKRFELTVLKLRKRRKREHIKVTRNLMFPTNKTALHHLHQHKASNFAVSVVDVL